MVESDWVASCGVGPNILNKGVETSPSAIWSGLCANYALSARSMLTASKTASDESW